LMYDPAGRNKPSRTGISGSRFLHKLQTGVFAFWTYETALAFTDQPEPRGSK
jgi:hypothetical protein